LKKFFMLSLSVALLLILIPACTAGDHSQATPATPSVTFSSSPTAINPGGPSNLEWNVTGATSVSIDQGIGVVSASGIRVVSPATSTTYNLTATNAAGTIIRSAVVTLNPR
jgi:hypothetical protein